MGSEAGGSRDVVLERYRGAIQYYWNSSGSNKRWYKVTRYLAIVLGALVTLISALSSASFVTDTRWVKGAFGLGTPILAAALAIVGGFAQNFQWGANWREMVLTAERLEKERDRFIVTPDAQVDLASELDRPNALILGETEGFFSRILGGADHTPAATGGTANRG
jgi:hypothetical protein